jgi:hypothetical protein
MALAVVAAVWKVEGTGMGAEGAAAMGAEGVGLVEAQAARLAERMANETNWAQEEVTAAMVVGGGKEVQKEPQATAEELHRHQTCIG